MELKQLILAAGVQNQSLFASVTDFLVLKISALAAANVVAQGIRWLTTFTELRDLILAAGVQHQSVAIVASTELLVVNITALAAANVVTQSIQWNVGWRTAEENASSTNGAV